MKECGFVNSIFCYCLLRNGEESEESISVSGMTSSKAYVFHKKRLMSRRFTLASLYLRLPRSMRVSAGCKGMPWIMLRRCSLYEGCTLESVEHAAVMGIAIGFIKRTDFSDSPVVMPHVVISDAEISRFVLQRKLNAQ